MEESEHLLRAEEGSYNARAVAPVWGLAAIYRTTSSQSHERALLCGSALLVGSFVRFIGILGILLSKSTGRSDSNAICRRVIQSDVGYFLERLLGWGSRPTADLACTAPRPHLQEASDPKVVGLSMVRHWSMASRYLIVRRNSQKRLPA